LEIMVCRYDRLIHFGLLAFRDLESIPAK